MYYFYHYIILIFLFIVHIKTAKTSTTRGDDNDNDVSYIKRQEAMQLFLKGRREYSQYRNYDKAKLYFIQSLELNSKNSDAHLGIGMINIKRNDPANAYYHFNEVTKLDPRNEIAAQNSFTSLNDMENVYMPQEAIKHIENSIKLRIEKSIINANYDEDEYSVCSDSWEIHNSYESRLYDMTLIDTKCMETLDTGTCLLYQDHTFDYYNKIYMEGRSGIMYSENLCSFFLRPSHGVMSGFPSRLLTLRRARKTIKYDKRVGSIIQTSMNNYYHFLIEGLPRLFLLLNHTYLNNPHDVNMEITHYLVPDTALMNETLKYIYKQKTWLKSNLNEENIIYYRPQQPHVRYYFEHLYTMDWNGINEEHIVYFPYDAEKGSEDFNEDDLLMDYTVFGEHLVWKRLANNYPIAYYFPNKKNLHIVQLYMNEILKSTSKNLDDNKTNSSLSSSQMVMMDVMEDQMNSGNIGDVEMHQVMDNTQRICYVSRNDSNKRVVIDEYQIIQMLNRDFKDIANITTIIPSNHNLLQQMFFFQTCTIVVGPHGAGLTNVLFTKSQYFKGMIIFPMISETEKTSYYKHLISTLYDDSRIIIFLNEMKSTRIGNYTGLFSDNKKDKILIEIKHSIVKILET